MYKVKVNNTEHVIEFANGSSDKGTLNGNTFELDLLAERENAFHVIKNNVSYTIEVVKADPVEKRFDIKVNGNVYSLELKDKYDELLLQLGLDNLKSKKVNELKAPMPGLVLEIRVKPGEAVKKGDPLLVLEAMKMENILKSPTDGVIKKVSVEKGVAVEKGQVLVIFE